MKMVAASKLKGAQSKCELSRGIWQPFYALFGNLYEAEGAATTLTLPITTDKGLCGGVNSGIVKIARGMMAIDSTDTDTLAIVGEKGKAQLVRTHADELKLVVGDTQKVAITFPLASMVAEKIL